MYEIGIVICQPSANHTVNVLHSPPSVRVVKETASMIV